MKALNFSSGTNTIGVDRWPLWALLFQGPAQPNPLALVDGRVPVTAAGRLLSCMTRSLKDERTHFLPQITFYGLLTL